MYTLPLTSTDTLGLHINPIKDLHFSHLIFFQLSISSRSQASDIITKSRYLKGLTAFRGVVPIHGGRITPNGELDRLQIIYTVLDLFTISPPPSEALHHKKGRIHLFASLPWYIYKYINIYIFQTDKVMRTMSSAYKSIYGVGLWRSLLT